jgi:Spx/MgsR family transcriptional regulator
MEPVILYGIRNCDSVKKARAWLDQRGVEYRFHDYKIAGIDRVRLDRWCADIGWEALLNRAGTTFRGLADSQKQGLSSDRAKTLMAAQPSLIKRPVVELNGRVIVGFKPELYKTLPW